MICSFLSDESQWPDRSMKKFGTAESINSSLVYYYQKKKCKMPDDYLSEWKEFSKGYKNTIASQIQAGRLPKAGSDKLTMSQYRTLCSAAALSEMQYAHCFLVLAWNCMTRSHGTGSIRYRHVSFDCDHMVIT